MIDEDVALDVLDAAQKKASVLLAEVRLEERDSRELAVRAGQVSNLTRFSDAGMNVRIVLPSGIGFASCDGISRQNGLKLVQNAFKQARGGRRKNPVSISPESPVRTNWVVKESRRLADVSPEEKLAFLREIDAAITRTGVNVKLSLIHI